MPFMADQKYDAECLAASLTASSTGTVGVELRFATNEGDALHVLWLTEKNRENIFRSLTALGIHDPSSFDPDHDLDQLVGARCQLVMGEDSYRGYSNVRVKWINGPKTVVDDTTREKARAFFGHTKTGPAPVPVSADGDLDGLEVTLDDVPF
jgi:hypothetical protein